MTTHEATISHSTTPTSVNVSAGPAADDPRLAFAKAVALCGQVIAAVQPEQLANPTPCTEFDVDALLDHLDLVLRRIAAIGRDEGPFSIVEHRDIAHADRMAAWTEAAHEVQAAWSDASVLDEPRTLSWTVMSGRDALGMYTSELVVHTWDLAQATGQRPAWDDEVVALAYDTMTAGLPFTERPADVPFADVVVVPADAPAIARLVGWTGRQP